MAYTSGIFHIDLVNGNDATRTSLTSCTASNPSGTITRINKTAHGLVTGAIVDLISFSSSLNGAYKITVVDANNFDLDDTAWPSPADTSGTVTPRGGMNWADAWLTINNGASSSRIQPGDELRIAKTAGEVSTGQNATWTQNSQTVTLASSVSKKIEDGIAAWTPATNVTATTSTTRKIGATSQELVIAASFTTGKVGYQTISGGGTQDFSGYRYINFWCYVSATKTADIFKICLCSDATGDTIVNEINIPATIGTNWHCFVLDYGGALGSNIQSVAVYANSDPGTMNIRIHNCFATNGGLSLKTLFGKTGECFYNMQSMDGTTIKIDSRNTGAAGQGYAGSTSTETLYYREPFDVNTNGTWATAQEAGDANNAKNHYSFGWNTGSNTRDGTTLIANLVSGSGVLFSAAQYNKFSHLHSARFSTATLSSYLELEDVVMAGFNQGVSVTSNEDLKLVSCKILNSATTPTLGDAVLCYDCDFSNNTGYGVTTYLSAKFVSCRFANNSSGSMNLSGSHSVWGLATLILRKCTLSDTTEFSGLKLGNVWSYDHDNTAGNHWGFTNGGTINWQTGTVHGSEPGAWRASITANTRTLLYPVIFKLAEVACNASSQVTVKVWVKKDHATNVGAALYIEDAIYSLSGISETTVTKASDTSWEQLTITFTPTQKGVVPIFCKTWYVAGTSNAYYGSVEVTQA